MTRLYGTEATRRQIRQACVDARDFLNLAKHGLDLHRKSPADWPLGPYVITRLERAARLTAWALDEARRMAEGEES